VIAWASAKIGDPLLWLRVPSLVAGTLLVPATFVLGRRLAGSRAGLVAAALCALSPFMIFYSTEARAYALMALLVVGSTLALLHALEGRSWGWWVVYAAAAAAAMYTHYTALLVLLPQFVWALAAHPEARLRVALASGAAALAFLPWLPSVADDSTAIAQQVIGAFDPLGFASVRRAILRAVLGAPFVPSGRLVGPIGFALAGLAVGLAAAAIAVRVRRERLPRPGWDAGLIAVLALGAPVGALAVSLVGEDIYIARNLTVSLPGIWIGLGALALAGRAPLATVAAVLLVGASAMGAGLLLLDDDNRRPPFNLAADLIDARGVPGDPVIEQRSLISGPLPGEMTELYTEEPHPTFRVGDAAGERRALARGREGRLFVVLRADLARPRDRTVADRPPGFRLVERRVLAGVSPVEVLVYAPSASAAGSR
jgi:4-amino-4-deoxy-L-arabinose transferase-like glycosyltransferase